MTLRSKPRENCTHCNGSGFVSASKDPDEVADCVCTDVPAPEDTAERIDAVATDLGVELMPWQREFVISAVRGEQVVLARGRKAGMSTAQRVVEGVRNV